MTQQQIDIARWLDLFLGENQIVEVRALEVGGRKSQSHFFRWPHQAGDLAVKASQLDAAGALGVYFTPNPLASEMISSLRASKDDDVLNINHLLVDIDTKRPDVKQPSTDDEKKASWETLCKVRELLTAEGLPPAITGDSGNGWHLAFPIEMRNNEAAKEWRKSILHWLKAECAGMNGIVDTSVYNAARIWRLYGTMTRKGTNTAERPHRYSRIIES